MVIDVDTACHKLLQLCNQKRNYELLKVTSHAVVDPRPVVPNFSFHGKFDYRLLKYRSFSRFSQSNSSNRWHGGATGRAPSG